MIKQIELLLKNVSLLATTYENGNIDVEKLDISNFDLAELYKSFYDEMNDYVAKMIASDAIILGSSLAENYDNEWFDNGFNCTTIVSPSLRISLLNFFTVSRCSL